MDTVTKSIKGTEAFVYVDDIPAATENRERHLEVLKMVFEAIKNSNLKPKPQKCVLFSEKVFFGQQITGDGVYADPEKAEMIKNYPRPYEVAELRTFLGMCSP